jgi:hypothetical protein
MRHDIKVDIVQRGRVYSVFYVEPLTARRKEMTTTCVSLPAAERVARRWQEKLNARPSRAERRTTLPTRQRCV